MSDKYVKTDVEGLVKDPVSGAILNIDNAKLLAYRQKKAHAIAASETADRIAKVEHDMQEIKGMLRQLLGSGN